MKFIPLSFIHVLCLLSHVVFPQEAFSGGRNSDIRADSHGSGGLSHASVVTPHNHMRMWKQLKIPRTAFTSLPNPKVSEIHTASTLSWLKSKTFHFSLKNEYLELNIKTLLMSESIHRLHPLNSMMASGYKSMGNAFTNIKSRPSLSL